MRTSYWFRVCKNMGQDVYVGLVSGLGYTKNRCGMYCAY